MLEKGTKAIDFTLPDKDGMMHSLSEFKGKKVVLYFYPKDNTSGCTSQALGYKELNEEFKENNAIIIGISKDSPKSHQSFITKYELPFLLLSDEKLEVLNAYQVYKEKTMYGKKVLGVVRSSYIIDENGIIIDAEEKVNAKENASCTLNLIKESK